MTAKAIMIQGTGSHVGKSILTSAFCRWFRNQGYRVAPFKAQNMSNNSFVTYEGGEIGRAQAVQAEACGLAPSIHMNPILLKPCSDTGAQVIVQGRALATLTAREYQAQMHDLFPRVMESFDVLSIEQDVVVLEGAGSPAEINLRPYDIVNMKMAHAADAPVILVGDIDRGGVFASLLGTLELLEIQDRQRIKGFIINKFRGDADILKPGLDYLESRTGIPVLGVLPFLYDLDVLEEDGLSDQRIRRNSMTAEPDKILVDVVWFPRISNFTDFAPFDSVPDVKLTYLRHVPERFPDVLILPGTKSTVADFLYLKSAGFTDWIEKCREAGVMIIGICGGYQMLGERILDPLGLESVEREIQGFGFLPMETVFEPQKATYRVRATHLATGETLEGYEIHMGKTRILKQSPPVFKIFRDSTSGLGLDDGCQSKDGRIWGSYLHGLFDNRDFRAWFLNLCRERKGLPVREAEVKAPSRENVYNSLADWLSSHLDMETICKIAGLSLIKNPDHV